MGHDEPRVMAAYTRAPLGWISLGWITLGWITLGWIALGWIALGWIALRNHSFEYNQLSLVDGRFAMVVSLATVAAFVNL